MDFNQRITKVIEYSNLSPAEFAEEIGVQRSSISHIISGRNKPSLDFMIKVKSNFPEINWDWLIIGIGEMLIQENDDKILQKEESNSIIEKKDKEKQQPLLPDLFSLINDENFGTDNFTKEEILANIPESNISRPNTNSSKINDSQPLENNLEKQFNPKKIKRIIIFFSDGSFESYEN